MIQTSVRLDDFLQEEVRSVLPVGNDLQHRTVAQPLIQGLPQRSDLTRKLNFLWYCQLFYLLSDLNVRVDLVSQITAAASLVHPPEAVRPPGEVSDLVQEEGRTLGLRQSSKYFPGRRRHSVSPGTSVTIQTQAPIGD